MNNIARLITSLVLAVNIIETSYLSDTETFTCVKYEKGVTEATEDSCEETVQEVRIVFPFDVVLTGSF